MTSVHRRRLVHGFRARTRGQRTIAERGRAEGAWGGDACAPNHFRIFFLPHCDGSILGCHFYEIVVV